MYECLANCRTDAYIRASFHHGTRNRGESSTMSKLSRRDFFGAAAAGAVLAAGATTPVRAKSATTALRSLTSDAKPITAAEREARLAKLQQLMTEQKVAAFLVESGSSLEYFTGVKWWRSERTTAALIPARGKTVVVTPYFEEPSIRETLQVDADVRTWKEDQSPFELLAGALREWSALEGALAVEPTTRYFILDRVGKASGQGRTLVPGDNFVGACRMHKSASELALMQTANNVTIAAIRHVHGRVAKGMKASDLLAILIDATTQLGGEHDFTLVLLNEASAFPHGSIKPQSVREGSIVLIDSTCKVHGYESDITRTWVFGEASKRQREVWKTVQRGQQIALETAKIGDPGRHDRQDRARLLREPRLEQGLHTARPLAPHRPRHRHGRARIAVPGAERYHAARGGNVLLGRARALHPRRVRHAARGLLAHDRAGPEDLHYAGQIARGSGVLVVPGHRPLCMRFIPCSMRRVAGAISSFTSVPSPSACCSRLALSRRCLPCITISSARKSSGR